MRKLSALVQHILEVTGLPPEQLTAFADNGALHPIGRDRGPLRPEPGTEGPVLQQVELGLFKYDGVIQIERYPGDGLAFAALVASWLMANDLDREGLADPTMNIDLNFKDGDADLDISVEFEERLAAIEDPQGDIPFNGKRWRVEAPVITPVEKLAGMKGAVSAGGSRG